MYRQYRKYFSWLGLILNKYFVSTLLFFSLINFAWAQFNAIQPISESALKTHVSFLASDNLQGRKPGKAGLENAAKYLQQQAEKKGLNPIGKNYYQEFEIISTRPDLRNSRIKIIGKDKSNTDSVLCINQHTSDLSLSGRVVFSGFGISDKNTENDDLTGIDVNGKIAICSTGKPSNDDSGRAFGWNSRLETEKADRLFDNGAKAVIFITSPEDTANKMFSQVFAYQNRNRYFVKPDNVSDRQKIFVATPKFADEILAEDGAYNTYLRQIQKEKDSVLKQFESHVEIEIHTSQFVASHKIKNVAGFIEGSDSVLKNECVVYMAHYDHLGVNSEEEVYNGADDNATGSAALLEIAGAFSREKFNPKRSVLFLWVTGEEIGLLGSGYYVEHAVFPIDKTVACINLDMIGRVYEPRDSVWKNSQKLVKGFDDVYALVSDFSPELVELTDSISTELGIHPDKSLPEYFFRSSDHYHFHSRNVPILNLSAGYHADYHKVTDDVSRIRFDKMKRITELAFWIGYEMAGN